MYIGVTLNHLKRHSAQEDFETVVSHSEKQAALPKTMLYQNDRVDETVVLVPNDLDMKCCP